MDVEWFRAVESPGGKAVTDAEGTAEEFWLALHSALKPPSRGAVFWSWEALVKEPEKMEMTRQALEARWPRD